jgi:hypothetical protein
MIEERTSTNVSPMRRWTKVKPMMPGYYWLREEDDPSTAHIVEVDASGVLLFGLEQIQSVSPNMQFWPQRIDPPST